MLFGFSSVSWEEKTELTMAVMRSPYLRPSQQNCSCEEIPDAKHLVLQSNGLDLSTKKRKKSKVSENEPYESGLSRGKGCNLSSL